MPSPAASSTQSSSNHTMPPVEDSESSTHTLTCTCQGHAYSYRRKDHYTYTALETLRPDDAHSLTTEDIPSAWPKAQRFVQECLIIQPFEYPKCAESDDFGGDDPVPGYLECDGKECNAEAIREAFGAGVAGLFERVARQILDAFAIPKQNLNASAFASDEFVHAVREGRGEQILDELDSKLDSMLTNATGLFLMGLARKRLLIAAIYLYGLSKLDGDKKAALAKVVAFAKRPGMRAYEDDKLKKELETLLAARFDFPEKRLELHEAFQSANLYKPARLYETLLVSRYPIFLKGNHTD